MTLSTPPKESALAASNERASPLLIKWLVLLAANWWFCGIAAVIIGGDALGTLPAQDGYIVKSHGTVTNVSGAVWVFSLTYSYLTLAFSPLVFSALIASHLLRDVPPAGRWVAVAFFCLPGGVWWALLSRAMLQSVQSYLAMIAI